MEEYAQERRELKEHEQQQRELKVQELKVRLQGQPVYVDPNEPAAAGSTWILRNIAGRWFGEDLNNAEVTVVR
jgi:hypothetical protein